MSKNKHPSNIEGWEGSIEELANAIENLRYDALGEFFYFLRKALVRRAMQDLDAGRTLLGAHLMSVSIEINNAALKMHKVWMVCEKYMKDE